MRSECRAATGPALVIKGGWRGCRGVGGLDATGCVAFGAGCLQAERLRNRRAERRAAARASAVQSELTPKAAKARLMVAGGCWRQHKEYRNGHPIHGF